MPQATRVLLVEDHEDARDLYTITLQLAGFEVQAVEDAEEAFAIARTWGPDIVVTDFLLKGGMTGADLCRRLHDDPVTGAIPTVVMTGSTRKQDAEAVLGAGCAEIRIKPYLPDQLIDDVKRFASGPAVGVRA